MQLLKGTNRYFVASIGHKVYDLATQLFPSYGTSCCQGSAAAAAAAIAEAFTDKQYYLVSGYRLGIL